jgi:hypothetical protein
VSGAPKLAFLITYGKDGISDKIKLGLNKAFLNKRNQTRPNASPKDSFWRGMAGRASLNQTLHTSDIPNYAKELF